MTEEGVKQPFEVGDEVSIHFPASQDKIEAFVAEKIDCIPAANNQEPHYLITQTRHQKTKLCRLNSKQFWVCSVRFWSFVSVIFVN